MKKKIRNSEELEMAICELKAKQESEFVALKSQMNHSYEELQPSKMIKRIFVSIKNEPEIKESALQSVLSLTGGYFSKRLLLGKTNSFFKSILGYLVQIGATKLISNKIITSNEQKS